MEQFRKYFLNLAGEIPSTVMDLWIYVAICHLAVMSSKAIITEWKLSLAFAAVWAWTRLYSFYKGPYKRAQRMNKLRDQIKENMAKAQEDKTRKSVQIEVDNE